MPKVSYVFYVFTLFSQGFHMFFRWFPYGPIWFPYGLKECSPCVRVALFQHPESPKRCQKMPKVFICFLSFHMVFICFSYGSHMVPYAFHMVSKNAQSV